MSTDIRIKTSFPNHHKTKKLISRLGPEGVWSLICLWLYVAQNYPDGDISSMSNEDIAIASNWTRDPDAFVNALISCGFIDETINDDGSITRKIHDWEEHNPWASKSHIRSKLGQIYANIRWRKERKLCSGKCQKCKSNATCDLYTQLQEIKNLNHTKPMGDPMGNPCLTHTATHGNPNAPSPPPSPAPHPVPSPAPEPSPSILTSSNSCTENASCDENRTQQENDEIVIFLPLNDKTEYPVTRTITEEFSQLYPAVDVEAELKKMRAWLLANPKRRKTKKGILRFVNHWLSKAQDSSGGFKNPSSGVAVWLQSKLQEDNQ